MVFLQGDLVRHLKAPGAPELGGKSSGRIEDKEKDSRRAVIGFMSRHI
jgi:hypothetical protein